MTGEDKTNIVAEETINEPKIARFTEFETKYNADIANLSQFKSIVESLSDLLGFEYAEGPDTYFTKPDRPDGSFGRYRVAKYPHDTKYAQWTTKFKPVGAKK